MSKDAQRILLVSSSGGVLLDLLALAPWWSRYDAIWAAVPAPDTESVLAPYHVRWIREASAKRPFALIPGLFRAWRQLRRDAPDLLVSAGSGCAIPYFLSARIIGIPSFWVSTLNVRTSPGISEKICARLASHVLLQQETLRSAHPGGIVIGELY